MGGRGEPELICMQQAFISPTPVAGKSFFQPCWEKKKTRVVAQGAGSVPSVRETYTGLLFWIRFHLFPSLLGERKGRGVLRRRRLDRAARVGEFAQTHALFPMFRCVSDPAMRTRGSFCGAGGWMCVVNVGEFVQGSCFWLFGAENCSG